MQLKPLQAAFHRGLKEQTYADGATLLQIPFDCDSTSTQYSVFPKDKSLGPIVEQSNP